MNFTNKEYDIFTGLVCEKGKIISLNKKADSARITISAKKVIEGTVIGDSIAVNGACLTVVRVDNTSFDADIMHESLNRTSFRNLSTGSEVNLEKSVTLNTLLGGHLVLGDIDTVGTIESIVNDGIAKIYKISLDKSYMKYIVEKGRINIDGASLTVIDVNDELGFFTVSLIPHTQKEIILGDMRPGDIVNIETDIIGKYIYKLANLENTNKKEKSGLTIAKLAENGFL